MIVEAIVSADGDNFGMSYSFAALPRVGDVILIIPPDGTKGTYWKVTRVVHLVTEGALPSRPAIHVVPDADVEK